MAHIFIKPEQEFYYAGDTVKGVVYLSLMQNYPGANLKIKLKGWESCKWLTESYIFEPPDQPKKQIPPGQMLEKDDLQLSGISSDTSEDSDRLRVGYIRKPNGQLYRIERHEGQNKFFQINQNLYSFGQGMMPAGQYAFPFAFQLNKEWPGTYNYKTGKVVARTKYEVKACCEVPGKKKSEVHHKMELFVYEQPTNVKSELKSINANIVSCCCCKQGTVDFKVYFNKNAYSFGETAVTWCELDNSQCKVNANHIIASLSHTLTVRDNNGQSRGFNNNINSVSIQGIQAGAKFCGKDAKKCDLKIDSRESFYKNSIQPTSSGKYVRSQYYLNVRASMDLCCECGGTTPSLSIPIIIFPAQKQVMTLPPQFQQNFQPQTMPVCNVVVGGMQVPAQPVRGGQHITVQQPPGMEGYQDPNQQQGFQQQPMQQGYQQQPMQQGYEQQPMMMQQPMMQ